MTPTAALMSPILAATDFSAPPAMPPTGPRAWQRRPAPR
jgi:hypothetical protein